MPKEISRRRAVISLGALALSAACQRSPEARRSAGRTRVVFKHQPLGGDPRPFHRLLAGFERAHPDVELVPELLPAAPGAVHQYYVTALEGRARDFDVLIVDVIWVAEFARAGWIANLASTFPSEWVRGHFLPGPAEAVLVEGGVFAIPWYADVGVLYRRKDIVELPPRRYDAITRLAAPKRMHVYLWQGLQSEALVCNAFEAIWGHGGVVQRGDRVLLDTPEARDALLYLRSLLTSGVSPPSVTSMAEEESRRVFQAGGAVLMRNWPYAWAEMQTKGSPVLGRVAVSALPTRSGELGSGALGGFQLALSAHTPPARAEAALRFIAYLTSLEANVVLALSYGRLPSRLHAYDDPRVITGAPMIAALRPIAEAAKPRPVTPYYPMIADTLAAEFSAAITGVRTVSECLERAQMLIDHLTEGVR